MPKPDAGGPDAGAPDAGGPDAGGPDAGGPDAGGPDAGGPDAGGPDAGGPDAGPVILGLFGPAEGGNGPGQACAGNVACVRAGEAIQAAIDAAPTGGVARLSNQQCVTFANGDVSVGPCP